MRSLAAGSRSHRFAGAFAFNGPGGATGVILAALESHLRGPVAYLMSDFPVRPTRYPKLAKLVLMAALSREAQLLMEQHSNRRIRSIATTAFTNRPVSMKYRPLFRVLTRKETPAEAFDYAVTYGAPLGEWTLEEALKRWRTRWGDDELAVAA